MAFGGDIPPCAGGIMGNLGHLPWPISETYGFHLDVLAALEGLCMATFSVPWADAPARPAMVGLQHTSFSFFPVNIDEEESIHRPTNDVYERYVPYVTSDTYGTNNIKVLVLNNIYKCVDFRVTYHETSHTMSCPFETSFCMFRS